MYFRRKSISENAPDSIASVTALAENENHAATATETRLITPPPTIVTVDTQSLQTALAKYVKVVANKNARLPVQGIHISTTADRLYLLGTDLEVFLHVTVPATVVATPSNGIVAEYKALLNAVKAIKDRQTLLSLHGEYLLVSDSASSHPYFQFWRNR